MQCRMAHVEVTAMIWETGKKKRDKVGKGISLSLRQSRSLSSVQESRTGARLYQRCDAACGTARL